MWTPKRILILLGGMLIFLIGFGVYSFFLGAIDGLPPLPSEYHWTDGSAATMHPGPDRRDIKLKESFGLECKEIYWSIKADLPKKGWGFAAQKFEILTDGRVKLSPFSAYVYSKARPKERSEINTVRCDEAILTLDRPVRESHELANRKVVAVELRARDGVAVRNNRQTPELHDDVDLRITNGSLFYEENRNLIWTDGYVKLQDLQAKPDPLVVSALGMEIHLTKEAAKSDKGKKNKSDAVTGVDKLVLKANVDLFMWVEGDTGFLGRQDGGEKSPAPAARGEPSAKREPSTKSGKPAPKSQLHIVCPGSFVYDVPKDMAVFERPSPTAKPLTPDPIVITRSLGGLDDVLDCDRLEMQFRKKSATADDATTYGAAGDAGGNDRRVHKEIESAVASARPGNQVHLTMETENLDAFCRELHYRCATDTNGPETILRGEPLLATKDAHQIQARELHLIGADKNGAGQKALVKGPGQIDLFDKAKQSYPIHAVWRDQLVATRENDGQRTLDVLTFTGDASFLDEDHRQELHAQRLELWLETLHQLAAPKQANPAVPRQRPSKLVALEKVSARSPELLVKNTHHLVVSFTEAPAERLPEAAPAVDPSSPPAGSPLVPVPEPKGGVAPAVEGQRGALGLPPPREGKPRPPLELEAREIKAYVVRRGGKDELKEVNAVDGVHVHQDAADAKDKGVDIRGETLNLVRNPKGDILYVLGDARQPSQLQLGELRLQGFKVTIDQEANRAEVEGAGAMSLPSKNTLDGGRPAKADSRITIHWSKSMLFNGKWAFFDDDKSATPGGVQAYQDNGTLLCLKLQIELDREVSFKEGQKGTQQAKVKKLICERKVRVEEQIKDAAGHLEKYHRLEAVELAMDNDGGPSTAHGPGMVELLAKGAAELLPQPGAKSQPPRQQVMRGTRVTYDGWLSSKVQNNTRISTFLDNVQVEHKPADRPNFPFDRQKLGKDDFYMSCNKLVVTTHAFPDNRSSQEMYAHGNVDFVMHDVVCRATVIKFDERSDQITIEGTPDNPAVIFKQVGRGKPPQAIKGGKMLYNRRTGAIQLQDGQIIQSRNGDADRDGIVCARMSIANVDAARRPASDSLLIARLHANRQDEPFVIARLIGRNDR